MLFYFIRHGQTEANRRHELAGSGIDHPLSPTGHEQAQALGASIQKRIGHPVHRLLVSDMTRTRQTADYVAKGLNLAIEIEPELREWHLGEWEGKSFAAFGHLLLGDGEPREGEARAVFYGRVHSAWKRHHHAERPYVMVSHGGVWLALQDLLKVPRFKIENCQLIRVFTASGGAWCASVVD